jgi:hypothetical protein
MDNINALELMVDKFNQYNLELATEGGMPESEAQKYVDANKDYVFMILFKIYKDLVSEGYLVK